MVNGWAHAWLSSLSSKPLRYSNTCPLTEPRIGLHAPVFNRVIQQRLFALLGLMFIVPLGNRAMSFWAVTGCATSACGRVPMFACWYDGINQGVIASCMASSFQARRNKVFKENAIVRNVFCWGRANEKKPALWTCVLEVLFSVFGASESNEVCTLFKQAFSWNIVCQYACTFNRQSDLLKSQYQSLNYTKASNPNSITKSQNIVVFIGDLCAML